MHNLINFCPTCGEERSYTTQEEQEKNKSLSCCKKTKSKTTSPKVTKPTIIKNQILNKTPIKITIKGKTVSKSNSYGIGVRGKFGFLYKTNAVKEYEERVAQAAQAAVNKKGWKLSDQDIEMRIKVYMPDNRKRDLDNTFKATQDALEGIVYYNDSQISSIIAHRFKDKDNPRIELIFKEKISK